MRDLLKSYRLTRYQLHKVKIKADLKRKELEQKSEVAPDNEEFLYMLNEATEECERINWYMNNLNFAIDWLNRGHGKGSRRSIHRRSREQLEIVMDPLKMQSFANPAACGSPTTITDSEREMINEALYLLTPRERECYEMKYCGCYSERQIASALNISQATVHEFIVKAEKKVNESLNNNIFLLAL